MRYFVGCNNVNEVKAKFRNLAKAHHPDTGGSNNEFIAIKQEYDMVLESNAYPVVNGYFRNPPDFSNLYNTPKEKTTTLDPKELERERAKRYFDKIRVDDDRFDVIDNIYTISKSGLSEAVNSLNKMDDLELDHFKYFTFIFSKPVSVAQGLHKIYLNNKMGW